MFSPTITETVELDRPNSPVISPQGTKIAYINQFTNLKENRYESHLYLFQDGQHYQLTRNYDVSHVEWIDDDRLLVLMQKLYSGENKKIHQLYYYSNLMGEPLKLTAHKSGISNFKSLSGNGILFSGKSPKRDDKKERKEQFGEFEHKEQEKSSDALYYTNIDQLTSYVNKAYRSSEEIIMDLKEPILDLSLYIKEEFSIVCYFGRKNSIYLTVKPYDDLYFLTETYHYHLELNLKEALKFFIDEKPENQEKDKDEETTLIDYKFDKLDLPSNVGGGFSAISPDGNHLLFSYNEQGPEFYRQPNIYLLPTISLQTKSLTCLTQNFDRDIMGIKWTEAGIFFSYFDYSTGKLAKLSLDGSISKINLDKFNLQMIFSASDNGILTGIAGGNETFFEIIRVDKTVDVITKYSEQVKDWSAGTVESIRWKSSDGTEIEGVLRKPNNYDPNKKYPLLFIVHGGPTWLSLSSLYERVDLVAYPTLQFLAKEMIIVKPNYRGSIGRDQYFKMLYKGNAGIGDLWDLESCIDHLVEKNMIDPEKIGCMGWSQGGYISAFAGTHSNRFTAVSMGAGISSWYTYYVSNDIRQWARHYLLGTPQEYPEQYKKTAPISAIANASTPFLIQHGENDQRVPLSNALEMQRNLEDKGIPVELFIFKNFGHGITKPRENRAVMFQNLVWFSHYLLGEDLDLLNSEHSSF